MRGISVLVLAVLLIVPFAAAEETFVSKTVDFFYGLFGATRAERITVKVADIVDGKRVELDSYIATYRRNYDFKDVAFRRVGKGERHNVSFKAGNAETKIEGFTANSENYAVHLVGCDKSAGTCNFRVNGMLIKDVGFDSAKGRNSFGLGNGVKVKVKDIKFDYCDERPICDYLFDSYDLVEVEVE